MFIVSSEHRWYFHFTANNIKKPLCVMFSYCVCDLWAMLSLSWLLQHERKIQEYAHSLQPLRKFLREVEGCLEPNPAVFCHFTFSRSSVLLHNPAMTKSWLSLSFVLFVWSFLTKNTPVLLPSLPCFLMFPSETFSILSILLNLVLWELSPFLSFPFPIVKFEVICWRYHLCHL